MAAPLIFDRKLVRRHRDRAVDKISKYDFLLQFAADDLIDRLQALRYIARPITRILELGARHGILTEKLRLLFPAAEIITTDLSSAMLAKNPTYTKVVADEEYLPFAPESFDLVVSLLNFHWVNDLPGSLKQINNILAPDGLLLCNLFGGGSLNHTRKMLMQTEIDHNQPVAPHISPFIFPEDMSLLMKRAGFSMPVTDTEIIEVEYSSFLNLCHDLRYMGETSALLNSPKTPLHRAVLAELNDNHHPLQENFEIITATGKR